MNLPAFTTLGAGPTVLMLHGNPTWSFYYRNVVKAFAGEHRCVVPFTSFAENEILADGSRPPVWVWS